MPDIVTTGRTWDQDDEASKPLIQHPALQGLGAALQFVDVEKKVPFLVDQGAALLDLNGMYLGSTGIRRSSPDEETALGLRVFHAYDEDKGTVNNLGNFMGSVQSTRVLLQERGLRSDIPIQDMVQLANEKIEADFGKDWTSIMRPERQKEIMASAMLSTMVENASYDINDDGVASELAFAKMKGAYRFLPEGMTASKFLSVLENAKTESQQYYAGVKVGTNYKSDTVNMLFQWQHGRKPTFTNASEEKAFLEATTKEFDHWMARVGTQARWKRVGHHVPLDKLDPSTNKLSLKELSWLQQATTEHDVLRATGVGMGDRFKFGEGQVRGYISQRLQDPEQTRLLLAQLIGNDNSPAIIQAERRILSAPPAERYRVFEREMQLGVPREVSNLYYSQQYGSMAPGLSKRFNDWFTRATINDVQRQDQALLNVPIQDTYPAALTTEARERAEGQRYARDVTSRQMQEALDKYPIPRALFHMVERIGHVVNATGVNRFQKALWGPLVKEFHRAYFGESGVMSMPRGEERSRANWEHPGELLLDKLGIMPGEEVFGRYAERMASGTAGWWDHVGLTWQMLYSGFVGMVGHAADQPLNLLLFDRALHTAGMGRTAVGKYMRNRGMNPRLVGAVELSIDPLGAGLEGLRNLAGYTANGAATLGARESALRNAMNKAKGMSDRKRGDVWKMLDAFKREAPKRYNTPEAYTSKMEAFFDVLQSDIEKHGEVKLNTMFKVSQDLAPGLDPTMVRDVFSLWTKNRPGQGRPESITKSWLRTQEQLERLDTPEAAAALQEMGVAPEVFMINIMNARTPGKRARLAQWLGRNAKAVLGEERAARLARYGKKVIDLVEALPEAARDALSTVAAHEEKVAEYQGYGRVLEQLETAAHRRSTEAVVQSKLLDIERQQLGREYGAVRTQLQETYAKAREMRERIAATKERQRKELNPTLGKKKAATARVEGDPLANSVLEVLSKNAKALTRRYKEVRERARQIGPEKQRLNEQLIREGRALNEVRQSLAELNDRKSNGFASDPHASAADTPFDVKFSDETMDWAAKYIADAYLLDGQVGNLGGHPAKLLDLHRVHKSKVAVKRGKLEAEQKHIAEVSKKVLTGEMRGRDGLKELGLKASVEGRRRSGETKVDEYVRLAGAKNVKLREQMRKLEQKVERSFRQALRDPKVWRIDSMDAAHARRFNMLRQRWDVARMNAEAGILPGQAAANTMPALLAITQESTALRTRHQALLSGFVDSKMDMVKAAISIMQEGEAMMTDRERTFLDSVLEGRIDKTHPEVTAEIFTLALEYGKYRPAIFKKLIDYGIIDPVVGELMMGRRYHGKLKAQGLLNKYPSAGNPSVLAVSPLKSPKWKHANVSHSTRMSRVLQRHQQKDANGKWEWGYEQKEFHVKDYGSHKAADAAAYEWRDKAIRERLVDPENVEVVTSISAEQLAAKGLITDQGFIQPHVMESFLADIAKMEVFSQLAAQADLVRPDLVKVPEALRGEWVKVEDTRAWGPMAGKYIHKRMIEMINHWDGWSNTLGAAAEAMRTHTSAVWNRELWGDMPEALSKDPSGAFPRLWRWADRQLRTMLITANIGSWTNNHLGNIQASFLGGVNPVSPRFWRHRAEFYKNLELIKEGKFEGNPHRELWDAGMAAGMGSASVGVEGSASLKIGTQGGKGILETAFAKRKRNDAVLRREVEVLEQAIDRMEMQYEMAEVKDVAGSAENIRQMRMALKEKQKGMISNEIKSGYENILHEIVNNWAGFKDRPAAFREALGEAYGAIDASYKWAYLRTARENGLTQEQAVSNMAALFQNYQAVSPTIRAMKQRPIVGAFVPAFPAEALRVVREAVSRDPARFFAVMGAPLAFNLTAMAARGIAPSDMFDSSHADTRWGQALEMLTALHVNIGDTQVRLSLLNGSILGPGLQASGIAKGLIEGRLTPGLENTFGPLAAAPLTIAANFASQFAFNNPMLNGLMDVAVGYNTREGTIDMNGEQSVLGQLGSNLLQYIAPNTLKKGIEGFGDTGVTSLITKHNKTALEALGRIGGINMSHYQPHERVARMALKYMPMQLRGKVLEEANETPRMIGKYGVRLGLAFEAGNIDEANKILDEGGKWAAEHMSFKKVVGGRVVDRVYTEKEGQDAVIKSAGRNLRQTIERIPLRYKADFVMDLDGKPESQMVPQARVAAWQELVDRKRVGRYTDLDGIRMAYKKCVEYAGATTDPMKQQLFTRAAGLLGRQYRSVARSQQRAARPSQVRRQLRQASPGARQGILLKSRFRTR